MSATKKNLIVCLHGLGSNGADMKGIFDDFDLSETILLTPTAPTRPVTWASGMSLTAWADIVGNTAECKDDWAGLEASRKVIEKMIDDTLKNNPTIKRSRVIVGGFSLGAALSYHIAVQQAERFGGIIALSGWVPVRSTPLKPTEAALETPVFHGHGDNDNMVPYSDGITGALREWGFKNITLKKYAGATHTVTPQEIEDIYDFIRDIYKN